MKVIVDFCIIPIGTGISLSKYIFLCQKILSNYPLDCRVHAYGTTIEGLWNDVFDAIKACHETLHDDGVIRLHTQLKIGTRTDKQQSAQDKIDSVINQF